MVKYADGRDNVYISRGVPIIYPASSATIAIVRAMAWYLEYIKDWDYIMLLTGQDYPLIPLSRIESILCHQNPAMPFLVGLISILLSCIIADVAHLPLDDLAC